MESPVHIPVLVDRLITLLDLRPGDRCVDATIDGGSHTRAMLEHTAPDGVVLGIDRDPELIAAVRRRLGDAVEAGRLQLDCGNFRELTRIAEAHACTGVRAVVLDLGLSSFHLDASGRGFSFSRDEPLDMRFDPTDAEVENAAEILASRSADEIAAIIREYGEERYARRIAATIAARRTVAPLRTTEELLDTIRQALPGRVRWQAARSAARVFQALRIAVNDELEAVAEVLPQALSLLAIGGRLAVIAFHSLEDRMVKQFFVSERQAGRVRILTKKPVRADDAEIQSNPRAAGAKLRVCERVEERLA
jgi:16S rRNA (cytosine1402-N4)-methyltransferase